MVTKLMQFQLDLTKLTLEYFIFLSRLNRVPNNQNLSSLLFYNNKNVLTLIINVSPTFQPD